MNTDKRGTRSLTVSLFLFIYVHLWLLYPRLIARLLVVAVLVRREVRHFHLGGRAQLAVAHFDGEGVGVVVGPHVEAQVVDRRAVHRRGHRDGQVFAARRQDQLVVVVGVIVEAHNV